MSTFEQEFIAFERDGFALRSAIRIRVKILCRAYGALLFFPPAYPRLRHGLPCCRA